MGRGARRRVAVSVRLLRGSFASRATTITTTTTTSSTIISHASLRCNFETPQARRKQPRRARDSCEMTGATKRQWQRSIFKDLACHHRPSPECEPTDIGADLS